MTSGGAPNRLATRRLATRRLANRRLATASPGPAPGAIVQVATHPAGVQ